MYLIDTNIFLEVLLSQEKMDICKKILDANIGNQYLSDFSLHSIGVILFKNGKENIFQKFSVDVVPKIEVITLSKEFYKNLANEKENTGLDFDDVYQFKIAEEYGLEIITMDKDFNKVKDKIKIKFI
ncbi:MAG: PIN domain-containing protein [Candidatus Kuenenia sp.]|nr:PIN domain-containing protein [Candidatus Kuenenia sp.]